MTYGIDNINIWFRFILIILVDISRNRSLFFALLAIVMSLMIPLCLSEPASLGVYDSPDPELYAVGVRGLGSGPARCHLSFYLE